jgi:hypothetical protein
MGQCPPTHERQRGHFDVTAGKPLNGLVGGQHVVKRVIKRTQVGIHFFANITGQETESFPCLHGGTRKNDAVDLTGLKQGDGSRHRKIRFAGPGRAQAEHQFIFVHGLDIGRLGGSPRGDPPPPGLNHGPARADHAAFAAGLQLARSRQADNRVNLALVGRRALLDTTI